MLRSCEWEPDGLPRGLTDVTAEMGPVEPDSAKGVESLDRGADAEHGSGAPE
jgi:hypothetical protein